MEITLKTLTAGLLRNPKKKKPSKRFIYIFNISD